VKAGSEQAGFRQAHLQDGAALCRFLYHMKTHPENYTELSAAALLHRCRAAQPEFREDSFPAIVAYGAHGAVVHYEPTEETDVPLQRRGLLLVDSGGHYRCGTTDVTRTVALGEVTARERRMSTLVLRGHIRLAMARFPRGVMGENLDALARMPLWEQGLDFLHGTGHGVGAHGCVHEGPHQIRMEYMPAPLRAGMTVTDEPGLYLEGKFGVRHENTLLIRPYMHTAFGDFLQMEPLTLCPFDTEPIVREMLLPEEAEWLNQYHHHVYQLLAPRLDDGERAWLENATRKI